MTVPTKNKIWHYVDSFTLEIKKKYFHRVPPVSKTTLGYIAIYLKVLKEGSIHENPINSLSIGKQNGITICNGVI